MKDLAIKDYYNSIYYQPKPFSLEEVSEIYLKLKPFLSAVDSFVQPLRRDKCLDNKLEEFHLQTASPERNCRRYIQWNPKRKYRKDLTFRDFLDIYGFKF